MRVVQRSEDKAERWAEEQTHGYKTTKLYHRRLCSSQPSQSWPETQAEVKMPLSCHSVQIGLPIRVGNPRNEEMHNGARTTIELFFKNCFQVTEEILHHLECQSGEGELLVIESFEDIRVENGNIEFLILWKRFDHSENDWDTVETFWE